jgi:Ycf66 protein N-terminus
MLAYILAVLVGTGSVGLYLAAFFFPEIHRKQDFIWSGVGCFYALFLWIYARQVTGGILVGQTTSVILLGWFGWQTFQLRRQLAPIDRATAIANAVQLPKRNLETKSAPKTPKPPAQTSTATPPPSIVSTPAPVATTKRSIEKPPTPATTKPSSIEKPPTPATTKPSSIERTTPIAAQIPLSEVKIPPANPKPEAPATRKPVEPTPPPTPVIDREVEEDRAWIKLEVKSDPDRSKQLGKPAQPPTPLLSAATPEVTPVTPTEAKTQTTLPIKIDPDEPN